MPTALCAVARKSTNLSARPATPLALLARPSSRTQQPGALASSKVWRHWFTLLWLARAPWQPKVAVSSTTLKLHVAWSLWPMLLAATSQNPSHRLVPLVMLLQPPLPQHPQQLLLLHQ